MIHTIGFYFLLFMAYSFVGWLIEVILTIVEDKKLVNRGFFVGPYCPIYGFGGIFATLILSKYNDDIFALFFLGVIIFSILEYFTSYVLEKIFHARWWDYSNYKFNINGRICFIGMVFFGILGVVVIKFVNPLLFTLLNNLSETTFDILFITILVLFIIDMIFSFNILDGIGKENKLVDKDNTEEINKIIINKITNLGWGYKRLMKAFPNIRIILNNAKNKIGENIKEYNQKQKKIKERADKKIEHLEEKHKSRINRLIAKYNKKIIDAGKDK